MPFYFLFDNTRFTGYTIIMNRLPQITEDIKNIERNLTTLIDNEATVEQIQARDLALDQAIVLKGLILQIEETFE